MRWTEIGRRVWAAMSEDNVLLVAAGVGFYLLLALFPALTAFVTLYGLFLDPATAVDQLAALRGVVPPSVMGVVAARVQALAAEPAATLGLGLAVSLFIALWGANGGVKAIMEGLNIVFDVPEGRGFVKRNLVALALMGGAAVIFAVMVVVLAVVPAVLALFPLGVVGEVALAVLRWPVLVVAVGAGLALLYRFGPCRTGGEWRWITWGSGLATLGWVAVSVGFAWYARSLADFDASYGAMATPIALLLWVWLSMVVVLLGAEVDAEMEQAKRGALSREGVASRR